MRSARFTRWSFQVAGTLLLVPHAGLAILAQNPSPPDSSSKPQDSSSKKSDPEDPVPFKPQPKKLPAPGTDQPAIDPLRAEKDIEVGRYYLHKGDLEAAIDRFQDAIQARPGYALPFRLLAEAQEKKGRRKEALKSYTRYLEIYPQAEDARKVRKRIEKLQQQLNKPGKKSG